MSQPGFPDAFLFDLDGTLVDSERQNVESVVIALGRHGVELSEEERRFVIGHSWNEIYAMIKGNHEFALSLRELVAASLEQRRVLTAVTGHQALPGAIDLLKRLAPRAKMVIVTGASRAEALDSLEGIGVLDLFEEVVAAESYARGKPDPEPYLRGLAVLGAEASRALAIEDAAPGVEAAHGAGVKVIGVQVGNFVGYDLSRADVVVETLNEVTDELCARLIG